jgi:A/G-specific adenine glycosylase
LDWFAQQLITWQRQHGRHDLPWQQQINPYSVWVSEIMLQQTQVATVIDYYLRFMQRFPTLGQLADAPIDDVLHHWTGLGYYARARNLHRAANIIKDDHAGKMPSTQEQLESLPGIGRSTAGAIRALAMNQYASILDGNVKRVLTRFHGIHGYPGETEITKNCGASQKSIRQKSRPPPTLRALWIWARPYVFAANPTVPLALCRADAKPSAPIRPLNCPVQNQRKLNP